MVSLVTGAIFIGVVGTWTLERTNALPGARGWLLPLLLIGVGIIGLVGIRPHRRTDESPDSPRSDWTEEEETPESRPVSTPDVDPSAQAEPSADEDSTRT